MVGIVGGLVGGSIVAVTIQAIDKFTPILKNINKKMLALGAASIAVGVSIGRAFTKTIPGASDLLEETSKLNTVFDEINQTDLAKTITELGDAYILSNVETTRLVASTGDLLTGLGFSDKAALGFSKTVVSLGSDLASFNNFQDGAAGAAKILEKALLGERESLKSLGISILESDLKQQLLIDGTSELTGLALKQARAEATLALVIQQSGNAIGDTARTSKDYANRQRELKKQTRNLSDSIGKVLLPIALKLTNVLISIAQGFNNLSPTVRTVIIGIAALVAVLLVLAGVIAIVTAAGSALAIVFSPITLIVLAIAAAIGLLIFAGVGLAKNWDKIKASAVELGKKIGDVFRGIANAVLKVWNFIVGTVENSINKIIKLINKLVRGINKIPGVKIPLVPKVDLGKLKATELTAPDRSSGRSNVTNINIEKIQGVDAEQITELMAVELSHRIRR